jgi:hypothetical protein
MTQSAFKTLVSHDFACMSSLAMSRMTKEHLAYRDLRETRVSGGTRYSCNSGGSRSSNVWSGEPRLYAARPWYYELITLGKILYSTNQVRSRSRSSKALNAL